MLRFAPDGEARSSSPGFGMSCKARHETPGAKLSLLKQEAAASPAAASPAAASPTAHIRTSFAVLLPLLGHQADMVRLVITHNRGALVLDKLSRLEQNYAELIAGASDAMENLRYEEHEIWSSIGPSTSFRDIARQAFLIDVRTRDHCVNVLAELSLLKQEACFRRHSACFRRHSGTRRDAQVGTLRDSLKTLLSSIDWAQTSWTHMLGSA